MFQRLHPRSADELRRAMHSGTGEESARAAAELCTLGEQGDEACARAERQAGSLPRRVSLL